MPQPDIDIDALSEIADRVLPGAGRPAVERMASGVSTPVYRIRRDGAACYLRLAESATASLAPEALVHGRLHALGVRVPEVVYFEPYNERIGRSLMVTAEISGEPVAVGVRGVDLSAVLTAAGRDLAIINSVEVAGFGWIRRDRPNSGRLDAERPSLRAVALDGVEQHLASLAGALTAGEIQQFEDVVVRDDVLLDATSARLAHGDFDATHIYHVNGQYSGIIDFGEIRGADAWYDLGHFALHDGELLPLSLLPHLLAGYGEVNPLPADHMARIRYWSLLIGFRTLSRIADRPETAYRAFLTGAMRRILAEATGASS